MIVENWGLVPYEEANRRQLLAVDEVAEGASERLIVCSHPPVVTLGRATPKEDVAGWNGDTFESSRGGRATYHGPNQIVIYPILDLRRSHPGIPERDIHAYLRALERATVAALRECGLRGCEARTAEVGGVSLTGVWTGTKKIASIGIAVRKWVTYHGVAINIFHDPHAFKGIQPCGFAPDVMTSLEARLRRPVDGESVREIFTQRFLRSFNPESSWASAADARSL